MQTKLVLKTLQKYPEFRFTLIAFRTKWVRHDYRCEWIVIKGQPIADKVIRDLDLEGYRFIEGHRLTL